MDALKNSTFCPVCGFDLGFEPWKGSNPSDEICPSCGIQFGYDDATPEGDSARQLIYQEWRQQWIKANMPWDKDRSTPPPGWDPIAQLHRIDVYL